MSVVCQINYGCEKLFFHFAKADTIKTRSAIYSLDCLQFVFDFRTFPWIIEVFDISPFYFYKVIEILIRAEDSLSRDVVKHLNHVSRILVFPRVHFHPQLLFIYVQIVLLLFN